VVTDVLPRPFTFPWLTGGFIGGLLGLWLALTTIVSNVFEAEVISVTEVHYPIKDVSVAAGKHGTYDVYILPVDASGVATGSEQLLANTEIYTNQGSNQLAFPGAQGFGRFSQGGRGGAVYIVDNLNDSGTGSFRECATATGARTCVFDVSGTININNATRLAIADGNITIAGQTSPGGVQLTGDYTVIRPSGNKSDFIFRHMKFRCGLDTSSQTATDRQSGFAMSTSNGIMSDVIYDRSEAMYCQDENADLKGQNITLQDSIAALSLNNSNHTEAPHGKCMLLDIGGTSNAISVIRNIVAHCNDRFPYTKGGNEQEFVNNVWSRSDVDTAYARPQPINSMLLIHFIGNYYLSQPGWTDEPILPLTSTYDSTTELYLEANEHENLGTNQNALLDTQSIGSMTVAGSKIAGYSWFPADDELTAQQALTYAVANAGASCPSVDALTELVRNDMSTSTGRVIDAPTDLSGVNGLPASGYPVLSGSHPDGYDDNNDGISDTWANYAQMEGGLTYQSIHENGWSYLENFINDLANDCEADGDFTFLTFNLRGAGTASYRVYVNDVGEAFNAGNPYSSVAAGDVR
jgi:hypothetical protein